MILSTFDRQFLSSVGMFWPLNTLDLRFEGITVPPRLWLPR